MKLRLFMRARRQTAGLLILAALLLAPSGLRAAPRLTIDTVRMQAGETTNLAVRLSGGSGYAGLGVTALLPPGLSCTGVQRGPCLPEGAFDLFHTIGTAGWQSRVSVLAVSSSNTITTTGILCLLTVRAAPEMPPGMYAVTFEADTAGGDVHSAHSVSSVDGALSIVHEQTDGAVDIFGTPTPFDTNGNGIPDAWEILHFGTLTNVTATTDADGDGLTDYYECLAGTDPRDASSALAVSGLSVDVHEPPGVVLEWYSIPGRTYRLFRTEEDLPQTGWIMIAPSVAATPPMNVYTDDVSTAVDRVFYKIDSPQ